VRARILSAAVILATAATVLTACRTNVGTAANVDGQRISENKVGDYVLTAGPTTTTDSNGSPIVPKSIVLQYLVLEQVFRKTLAANGGVPTAAELAADHDKAVQLLMQSQITGTAFDKGLATQLKAVGIKNSLASTYLQVQELEYTLVERKQLASPTAVADLVAKTGVSVRINPRYGSWVAGQLGIDVSGGQPAYLKLQTTSAG
jgi:hypothetical protein